MADAKYMVAFKAARRAGLNEDEAGRLASDLKDCMALAADGEMWAPSLTSGDLSNPIGVTPSLVPIADAVRQRIDKMPRDYGNFGDVGRAQTDSGYDQAWAENDPRGRAEAYRRHTAQLDHEQRRRGVA